MFKGISEGVRYFVVLFATIMIGLMVFIRGISVTVTEGERQYYSEEGTRIVCNYNGTLEMFIVYRDTGRFYITDDDVIFNKNDCDLVEHEGM